MSVLERLVPRGIKYETLEVTANVTETITGITEIKSETVQYSDSAFKIDFHPSMPDNFKPGFGPYPVTVSNMSIYNTD